MNEKKKPEYELSISVARWEPGKYSVSVWDRQLGEKGERTVSMNATSASGIMDCLRMIGADVAGKVSNP